MSRQAFVTPSPAGPRLARQIAVVTGGGRGIGKAIAGALAAEGAEVFLAARTEAQIRSVAAEIMSAGGRARAVVADVARPGDVERLFAEATRGGDGVDILVNAAGVYGPIGSTWETDPETWLGAQHVNLFGTYLCCRAAVPLMMQRGGGRIVNLSGGGATAPLPRFSAYACSKAAVVRLTETLAEETAPFHIRVNAIAPGAVDTELQDAVIAAGDRAGPLHQRIANMRQTGQGAVPASLAAHLAVFLCSDASAGLTGRLIAAPYDRWQSWDADVIRDFTKFPWFTLRRLDEATLRPMVSALRCVAGAE